MVNNGKLKFQYWMYGFVQLAILGGIIISIWAVPPSVDYCRTNSDGDLIDSKGNVIDNQTCFSYIEGAKKLALVIFGIPMIVVLLQMIYQRKKFKKERGSVL